MIIIKKGDFYQAAHVTSVRDNVLMLAVAERSDQQGHPTVETLAAPVGHGQYALDLEAVLTAILHGVDDANVEHGTNYRVIAVRYYTPADGPETVYGYMAHKIIDHIVSEARRQSANS